MRPAFALALLISACGGAAIDETASPAGVVIDAVADPEVRAECKATDDQVRALLTSTTAQCWCETECPAPLQALHGRCVSEAEARAEAPASFHVGSACPSAAAEAQRRDGGCEVPVWPLARCASVE